MSEKLLIVFVDQFSNCSLLQNDPDHGDIIIVYIIIPLNYQAVL